MEHSEISLKQLLCDWIFISLLLGLCADWLLGWREAFVTMEGRPLTLLLLVCPLIHPLLCCFLFFDSDIRSKHWCRDALPALQLPDCARSLPCVLARSCRWEGALHLILVSNNVTWCFLYLLS